MQNSSHAPGDLPPPYTSHDGPPTYTTYPASSASAWDDDVEAADHHLHVEPLSIRRPVAVYVPSCATHTRPSHTLASSSNQGVRKPVGPPHTPRLAYNLRTAVPTQTPANVLIHRGRSSLNRRGVERNMRNRTRPTFCGGFKAIAAFLIGVGIVALTGFFVHLNRNLTFD